MKHFTSDALFQTLNGCSWPTFGPTVEKKAAKILTRGGFRGYAGMLISYTLTWPRSSDPNWSPQSNPVSPSPTASWSFYPLLSPFLTFSPLPHASFGPESLAYDLRSTAILGLTSYLPNNKSYCLILIICRCISTLNVAKLSQFKCPCPPHQHCDVLYIDVHAHTYTATGMACAFGGQLLI